MKKQTHAIEETASAPLVAPPVVDLQTAKIPIDKVIPSPTNPRKHFKPEEQEEMERSMRTRGFTMSMLLVRPMRRNLIIDTKSESVGKFFVCEVTPENPDGRPVEGGMVPTMEAATALLNSLEGCYELVAGERRWRAAKAVGIKEVPCIVREMTDQEVLEEQLVENVQRQDLTAIEEAEGLARLLDLRDANGKPFHTTETLAAKIGKSIRHIERRAKLAKLGGEARKAVESGFLPANTALLIARIPDVGLREQATKEILHPQYHEAPLSLRQAEEVINQRFMRDLRAATFDTKDANLLEIGFDETGARCSGGACTDCPFRLGNAANLADDLPSGAARNSLSQMCMNPACYEEKAKAGWRKWQESETDASKKRRALSEEECKKIYRYGDQLDWNASYVDLAERPDGNDLKAGKSAPGTWRKMTAGSEIEVLVAKDRIGKAHELVNRELAIEAAKANGHDIFKAEKKGGSGGGGGGWKPPTEEERRKEAKKQADTRELDVAIEDAEASAVFAKAEKAKALPAGFWMTVIGQMSHHYWGRDIARMETVRGWKEDSFAKEAEKLPVSSQAALAAEFLVRNRADEGTRDAMIKMFEVDAKAIKDEVTPRIKAVQKERDGLHKEIAALVEKLKWKDKNIEGFVGKHAKACQLQKGAQLWQIRHVPTLQFLRNELVTAAAKLAPETPAKDKPAKDKKGGISPEGLARIKAEQKKRWAKHKAAAEKKGAAK